MPTCAALSGYAAFKDYLAGVTITFPSGRLRQALACAAASAAAVVSYAGLLGFVGLVVPHITRRLTGERPVRMLPVSALLGAILVVLADLIGRTLFAPSELPVGILMSLIGAPFFLILLFRRKNHAGVL